MTIKTLHITNSYHQNSGGIGTFYRALLADAVKHERRMVLVVPAEQDSVETLNQHCRIYHLAAPRAPVFDRRYRMLLPTSYWLGRQKRLRAILQGEQPDLVEVCDKYSLNWLAGLWRKGWLGLRHRPTLIGMSCERMDDNINAFVTKHALARHCTRHYLGYCYLPLFDAHIANSTYTAAELHAAQVPGHARPIHVLPMGAAIEHFAQTQRNDPRRARLVRLMNGDENTRLLLYAGRLSPEKNLPLLLDMMRQLKADRAIDYRLLIAGDGPLREWLEIESEWHFPHHVYLLGHLGAKQALLELYADCDAFIHPNPREPFGIAPLEAMAAGLPLVAPKAGGVLAYADQSNAWLAEPNGASFAQAAREVMTSESARLTKLAHAKQRAAQFSWSNVTPQFFALYEKLHRQFSPEVQASRSAPNLVNLTQEES
jgi:alpha-1,6-mannosyltransferase